MNIIALETPENTEKHAAPSSVATSPFYLSLYGRTTTGTPCYQIRLASEVYTLQYVTEGAGVLICNDRIYTVGKGDAFLLPKGTDQIYYSMPEHDFARLWINFSGPLADSLLSVYGIAERRVFCGEEIAQAMERLQTVARHATDPEVYERETARCFLALVQVLAAQGRAGKNPPETVERIRLYIDTHIKENLRIGQIARSVGFSPEYLIRLFKKTYGITPHRYILQSKIRISMVKLASGKESIEQIAQALFFSDARHFSAQFLRCVGMRPSEYRRRYRK